jgi:Protein of unknown function (DUF4236)/Protein of unknown function (DUF732)
MGWQFRQSKKVGPLRLTVTKRGISGSVGTGPLRVGVNSRGQVRRTVRVPGAGLYNTKVVGNVPTKRSQTKTQQTANTRPEGTEKSGTPPKPDLVPMRTWLWIAAVTVSLGVFVSLVGGWGSGMWGPSVTVGFWLAFIVGCLLTAGALISLMVKQFKWGYDRATEAQRAERIEQLRDPVFLETLRNGGILISSDHNAIALAHRMCRAAAEKHLSLRELMTLVQEVELTFTDQDAAEFLGAALAAYCPEEFARVFGEK